MAKKKILCLDFDGVLHSYRSGWKGIDVIPDPPVDGAQQFLKEAMTHFHVNILSSRSREAKGREAMKLWCMKHGFPDGIFFPESKPAASVSLDDRCLTFRGQFPNMETLTSFKSWVQKEV